MNNLDLLAVCVTNLFARLHAYALSPVLPLQVDRHHLSSVYDSIIFSAYSLSQIFIPFILLSSCLNSLQFSSFLILALLLVSGSFILVSLFYNTASPTLFLAIAILA